MTSSEDEDITFDVLVATTILDDDNDSLFHDSTVILDPTTVKELDAFRSKVNKDQQYDIFHDALDSVSEIETQSPYSYFKSMVLAILVLPLVLPFYYHSMLMRLFILMFSGGLMSSFIITFALCFEVPLRFTWIQ